MCEARVSRTMSFIPPLTGTARGTARVISSVSQAGRFQPGDVLVVDALSPSWTPLFMTAAAIVANTGGVLSHAAAVAREYGVPPVLGARGATASIHDGQIVEVDGAAGIVRVVPDRSRCPHDAVMVR
jgi:rifampicin phosphotransferase